MWLAIIWFCTAMLAVWVGVRYVDKKSKEIEEENAPFNEQIDKFERLNALQFEIKVLTLLGRELEAKFLWVEANRLAQELGT